MEKLLVVVSLHLSDSDGFICFRLLFFLFLLLRFRLGCWCGHWLTHRRGDLLLSGLLLFVDLDNFLLGRLLLDFGSLLLGLCLLLWCYLLLRWCLLLGSFFLWCGYRFTSGSLGRSSFIKEFIKRIFWCLLLLSLFLSLLALLSSFFGSFTLFSSLLFLNFFLLLLQFSLLLQ